MATALAKYQPRTSSGHLSRLFSKAQSLAKHATRVREKGESIVGQGLRTVEISGAAFAAGYIQGKEGGKELLGMPVELVAGIGLHAAGFAGLAGKHSHHLHNVADGSLAAYFTTVGRGLGMEKKGGKGKMSGDTESGRRGLGATQDMLRNLARYSRTSAG